MSLIHIILTILVMLVIILVVSLITIIVIANKLNDVLSKIYDEDCIEDPNQ